MSLLLGCGASAPPPRPVPPPVAARQASTSQAPDSTVTPGPPSESPADEVGLASWYGNAFAGRPTASGERFDPGQLTAAHKTLPFGTIVEVRRLDTGRTVRVRINDRGPNGHAANRIIDLSRRAAEELDMTRAGVVRVEVRRLR